MTFYERIYPIGKPEKFALFAFKAFDDDNSGRISFSEFILSTAFAIKKGSTREEQKGRLEMAFDIFDVNNDGKIDAKELQLLFDAISEMDREDKRENRLIAKEILKKYDLDHNKSLNKAEFIDACLHEQIFDSFH